MRRRSEVFAVFKEASFDAVLMPMVAAARAGQLNLQILRRLVQCRRCYGVEMLNADDAKEYKLRHQKCQEDGRQLTVVWQKWDVLKM